MGRPLYSFTHDGTDCPGCGQSLEEILVNGKEASVTPSWDVVEGFGQGNEESPVALILTDPEPTAKCNNCEHRLILESNHEEGI